MILEKARELGLALSTSEEFIRMNQARVVMDADEETNSDLQSFQGKREELVTLLSSENADRIQIAAISGEVDRLQNKLLENPVFSEAMEAQNQFQNLMNQVNREIGACIGIPMEEQGGCSGSCASCGGDCAH